jgi:flagellar P-ring protein precursor FlgI
MKKLFLIFALFVLAASALPAQTQPMPVRLKDIARIIEDRDNALLGFGIVVGLRNTGDSRNSKFTNLALQNMLGKMGVNPGTSFQSRNAASVMVTATLKPFVKKGQRIDCVVSALGDSTSLVGGMLLLTPLQGPDFKSYALAQGPVVVGGYSEESSQSKVYKNETTAGRISNGAIVEVEVPVTFEDQHNITLVLNDSNFITVSRAVKAVQENGFPGAQATDANTIKIPLEDLESSDLISTLAKLEDITLVPDSSDKIVINSQTGTIVIGEMVRLFPVALTHGNISVRITETAAGAVAAEGAPRGVEIQEGGDKLIYLNPTSTLSSLVNALNETGASAKDLISIIQALKASGALVADIEII